MGELERSGGDTEEIGVRYPRRGSRRVLGTQRPALWIPHREARSLQPPGPLATSLGQQVPDALGIPSRRWRHGSGFPGEDLTLGHQASPGAFPYPRWQSRSGPVRDPGIAGSPDGNPAFDRQCPQGLFPWQHRAVRPVGSRPLRAQGWQPPLVPAFVPIFWLVLDPGCVAQRRE